MDPNMSGYLLQSLNHEVWLDPDMVVECMQKQVPTLANML